MANLDKELRRAAAKRIAVFAASSGLLFVITLAVIFVINLSIEQRDTKQLLYYIVYGAVGLILHFGRHFFDKLVSVVVIILLATGYAFGFYVASRFDTLLFEDFVALVCLYSIYLFILLSEMLLLGLSERLTKWRGEKWAKEIDYFYIAFAAIGLIASINKLNFISDKIDFPDVYGPMVVSTALVLRTVKTRVEINNWNKL